MAEFDAVRARTKHALPMWVDSFLRDTMHLTAEHIGSYNLLLYAMWGRPSCDLPNDDAQLAAVCRTTKVIWLRKIKPVIWPLLKVDGGVVFSSRLQKEAVFCEKYLMSQSQKKRGKFSGKPLKDNDTASTGDWSGDTSPENPTQQPNNPTVKKEDPPPPCADPDPPRKRGTQAAAEPAAPPEPKRPKARMPADWHPGDEGVAYALKFIPKEFLDDDIAEFRAYWRDRTDRDGSKSAEGWIACWQGHCRRSAAKRPAPAPVTGRGGGHQNLLAGFAIAARRPND